MCVARHSRPAGKLGLLRRWYGSTAGVAVVLSCGEAHGMARNGTIYYTSSWALLPISRGVLGSLQASMLLCTGTRQHPCPLTPNPNPKRPCAPRRHATSHHHQRLL